VAQTQGQIGYMIESTLDEALMELGIDSRPLVSLISYVVVDRKRSGLQAPSKPIGPVTARRSGRPGALPHPLTAKGYRRVVASRNRSPSSKSGKSSS
jgi:carbamate kinase